MQNLKFISDFKFLLGILVIMFSYTVDQFNVHGHAGK